MMDSVVMSHHVRRHSGTKFNAAHPGSRRSSTSSSISSASTGISRYGGMGRVPATAAASGQAVDFGSGGRAQAQLQGTVQLMREPYDVPPSPSASGSTSGPGSVSVSISGSRSTSASAAINIVSAPTSPGRTEAVVDDDYDDGLGPRSFTEGYYEAGEAKIEKLGDGGVYAYPVRYLERPPLAESKGGGGAH